jgi:PAS domain S-box-containing protein
MYSLASFSISDMTECASELRKLGAGASSAQEVAQRIASYLYRQLGNDETGRQDCALVRCFLVRAYRELDPQSQDCARQVLGRAPDSSDMKCLTLLGTAGERPEWNERDRSRRYRSIPLAGKQFVSQLPMFSQLLQQLGVELESKAEPESDLLVDWVEQTFNVFHVGEAKGSPFVPAQEEFVIPFGIQSVLGFGGVLPSKELFTVILFSKQKISRETAELFKPLALSVKLALLSFDGSGSQRSIIQVENQPEHWQARAEALEQLLVAHERTVTHYASQRKQTLEEVRDREEQFRQVFEEAPVGMIVLDDQRHFIRVNRSFRNLVGYNEAELIGRGYELCVHPDDFQENVALTNEFYEGKRTGYRLEKRYLRKDGQVLWVAVNATAYRIPTQQPKVVLVVIEDITERKRAEDALRATKEKLQQALLASKTGLWNWNTDTNEMFFSSEWKSQLGYGEQDLANAFETWETLLHADDHEKAMAYVRAYLKNPVGDYRQEFRLRHKDGSYRWIAAAASFVVEPDGRRVRLLGSHIDITESKRAEEALRESEERFKAIVTNSPALVFLKDTEGRYLQVNRRFEESFHVANRDLVGKTDQDIFLPEQAAAFRANDRKVLEARRPMEFEEVVFHDDGLHTSIVVKFPLLNAQGECYALCGIVTDITERKRAVEELRRSEAFITSVVENLPHMIFVKDAKDLKFVRFNKAGEDLLGQSREFLIGKSDYDLFSKEEADFFTKNDRQVLKSGGLLDIPEEPIETKHQGRRILHTKKIPICDDTGEPQYLLGISEDITDWKRVEQAQKESEERYRSIFENAVEGIFQTTLDGKYVAVNPALARMYGYDSPDDMIAAITNIASQLYVDPGRRDEFIRLIRARGEVTGFEALVYRKDGSFIWIAENVRALCDPAGVLVGYEGTVENITERKLAERRLLDTLDQVRTLSGRLATVQEEERTRIARELHDELGVRLTCLKIDLSRLHTMMSEGAGAGARKKAGGKIQSMVEQIDTTIASLQRLVTELRPAVLDDLGLVAAIEWQCQDFQKRTGIPCTCVTSADDIAMEPKRATALFRICQEALTNTARHAQATAVTIKLESRSDFLQLVVADNGVGIPDSKVSNRRSLGLLGMKERVALFGGELTVQSNPGKGTTITACLPR